MHRTQLLVPEDLHLRAKRLAREEGISLGALAREALAAYVASHGAWRAADPLLDQPYDDPRPDPALSEDADHHLYGAERRSRPSKSKPAARKKALHRKR